MKKVVIYSPVGTFTVVTDQLSESQKKILENAGKETYHKPLVDIITDQGMATFSSQVVANSVITIEY